MDLIKIKELKVKEGERQGETTYLYYPPFATPVWRSRRQTGMHC